MLRIAGEFQLKVMNMIDGVVVKKLKVIPDERGRLMELFRSDDSDFKGFGQAYMTTVNFGVVKAWHYHKEQTDSFAVVSGMVRIGMYDSRDGSPTKGESLSVYAGIHNPVLVQIPPGVYHGFKGISEGESIVINIPDKLFNYSSPDEYRVEPHSADIPFDWERRDG